jgi:uncharacterized protein YegL
MSTRRLPVFIAIDTSGSMRGEPIESVNVGMQAMLQAMRQDPYALESVYLSVLTYDIEVTELFPLTALENVQLPTITCPDSGPTHLGEALKMVVERFDRDVVQSNEQGKGDWRPMFFVMTDGAPSDVQLFNEMIVKVKQRSFAKIIACAAGPKAKTEYLTKFADQVVSLDTTDSAAFAAFFKWVSGSITAGSASAGISPDQGDALPPPPDEIQIVI